MKRLVGLALAVVMSLSLAACGKEAETMKDNKTLMDGFYMEGHNSDEKPVTLGVPDVKLNAEEIYSKITYIPEMFYGNYRLKGGKTAEEKFAAEAAYHTDMLGGEECEMTILPFQIEAGAATLQHSVSFIEGYDWMRVYFMKKADDGKAYLDFKLGSYTVEGNILKIQLLDTFNVDQENNKITYTFSDTVWEYEFAFKGRTLTLTRDGESITLTTGLDAYGEYDYFYVDNYLSPDSMSADGIDQISFRYDAEDKETNLYLEMVTGECCYNPSGLLQENGLIKFTIALEEGTKTYQYLYFYGGRDGIVLTDGTNVYYYNDTYSDRNKNTLNKYLTEDQTGKLDQLSEAELEAIAKKQENLMDDLAKAFNDAGIKVTVDAATGELAMDSSVLFGGDSSVLTDEGKAFLNKFVDAYTSIVFSEKYDGFVAKTMVEGHTAPVAGSTYESGLPLSVERADNVKNYCVSAETGVDTTKLAASLEAVGYSNSKPITDVSGNVDMAASRRVSFRFIINLEQN